MAFNSRQSLLAASRTTISIEVTENKMHGTEHIALMMSAGPSSLHATGGSRPIAAYLAATKLALTPAGMKRVAHRIATQKILRPETLPQMRSELCLVAHNTRRDVLTTLVAPSVIDQYNFDMSLKAVNASR